MEISSHSLSSMVTSFLCSFPILTMQWSGESGKLVERMFDVVKARLADPSTFVVVLIDEVESLTSARKSAGTRTECSDSLAAVNALLVGGFRQSCPHCHRHPQTQIDTIKRFPNVLVLATSNLTGSIDLAFVDR